MYKVINVEPRDEKESEIQFLRKRVEFLESALISISKPDRGPEVDISGLQPMMPKILSRSDRQKAFEVFEQANPDWKDRKVSNG